ncbi:hypothetical protein NGRA_3395, partial [Nosema granulosis]
MIIADIIVCPVHSRKITWSTRSARWIKRYLRLSLNDVSGLNLNEVYETIKKVFVGRKSYAKSTSSKFREYLKLKKLNCKVLLKEIKERDLMKFVLLRIGRIVWTNELVARKIIDDRYKDR